MKENGKIIIFCISFFLFLYIIRDKDAPVERFPLSEKNQAVSPHGVFDKGIEMELRDCAFPLLADVICTAD